MKEQASQIIRAAIVAFEFIHGVDAALPVTMPLLQAYEAALKLEALTPEVLAHVDAA